MKPLSTRVQKLFDKGENAPVKRKKPIIPLWIVRSFVILVIIGAVVTSAACKAGVGRICTLGTAAYGITCPLGYLEMALASRSLLPKLLPGVGLAVLLIILFGRAFCAWICPGALINTIRNKTSHLLHFRRRVRSAGNGNTNESRAVLPGNHIGMQRETPKNGRLTGLAILIGTLVSSYLFGFPVFCLVCPVGLVFGTVFAVLRLFHSAPPGLELVVFPALLVVEFFLLRSWCSSFCPLGALHSLIASINPSFRLRVDDKKCLLGRGANCRVCEKACPEGVHLPKASPGVNPANCTKCLDCYESCPVKAINLKLS